MCLRLRLAYTAPTSGVSQVRRDDRLVKRAVPVDRVERLVVGYKRCTIAPQSMVLTQPLGR